MNNLIIPSYKEELQQLRKNLQEILPAQPLTLFDTEAEDMQQEFSAVLQLKVGNKAPLFMLSNAINKPVALADLLKTGKVVLVFYRGSWCPYCNLMLAQYQRILPEIEAAGAQLVTISPQTPDASLSLKEKKDLQFEVLSDPGNMVTRKYTTVFKASDASLETFVALGIDFNTHYADDSGEIPIPAVFIIEQDGMVSFAASEGGDYRNRVEPAAILDTLMQ